MPMPPPNRMAMRQSLGTAASNVRGEDGVRSCIFP